MDFSHSKDLIKTPNFGGAPNLEQLNLEECTKLAMIHPSIGHLSKLVDLNLKNCTSLMTLPNNIIGLSSLQLLNLSGCSKAMHCQSASSMREWLMWPFRFFYSGSHEDSAGLLLPSYPSLTNLDLSFCNLFQVPDAIARKHCLKSLDLGGNHFVTLPSSVRELPRLEYLNLEHCKQLEYLYEHPSSTILPVRSEPFRGIYIYNCPKLIEMENYSSMAFSWMMQFIHRSPCQCCWFDTVIPGSQIPKWFNNQSVGSSISIDPSLIINDRNCIGIACCAVFAARDAPTNLRAKGDINFCLGLRARHGRCSSHCYFGIRLDVGANLVTVESDHLLLFFICRGKFINGINLLREDGPDAEIKLVTTLMSDHEPGMHMDVGKNFGWRWVFKEDMEGLNPN